MGEGLRLPQSSFNVSRLRNSSCDSLLLCGVLKVTSWMFSTSTAFTPSLVWTRMMLPFSGVLGAAFGSPVVASSSELR